MLIKLQSRNGQFDGVFILDEFDEESCNVSYSN